jgi:photosystem II stability/assembly factor-like uncharacterized protein
MRIRIGFAALALCLSVVVKTQDAAPSAQNTKLRDVNTIVDPRDYQDLRWRSVGPTRGGRVTAVAGVRSQPCTFYMGGTGGGVFKTDTCGERWTPISDGQIADGSIGSIDVSESNPNVVYVGTGSAAIRSNVIIGRGVYKSTDAGRTWQFMGLKDSGQIGVVKVHPANPDIAWLAALGSPFGPNEERGIFKTTDGGKTWRKVLFVNNETGGRALAVNMSNPDEIYAGMYKGFRKGWDIISGGPASEGGIYKSTDGGEHWTHLTNGLPQNLIGKIDIDVARSQPRTVYAMIEAPAREGGLYRSDDSGATWRTVNPAANLRSRPFYFNYVDVNPKNPEEVWVNALSLYKSTDGGQTFQTVQAPHGDMHGIWFNPDNPNIAIQCNDGGATVTTDGGRSWSSILNQPTAEIYMVSVDDQYPYRLYGPQQDNTTFVVPSVPPHSWSWDNPAQAWTQASGCETGGIWPRPDGSVVWGACKGEVERYSALSGQSQATWIYPQNRYGQDPDNIKYRFPRSTVIYLSPHNPTVIYQASHVLHRSTDDGVTWQVISPDLTAHEPDLQVVPGRPITRDVTGEEVYSSIYSMVESRLEPGVIWVGANDGPVSVTRDNGRTWKRVTPKDLPIGGRVQNIEDSPHRKGSAYIAVYRYLREHDLQPYIYVTNDYGETWTRLTDGTNGIPNDFPTRVVREDPNRAGLLYAGTEFGAFVSFDSGRHWQSLQQNLPATPVTDIRVHRKDLVISTMGRSFWILDDVSPLQQLGAEQARNAGSGTREAPLLLQPRDTIRYRYAAAVRGGSGVPQYPPVAATIDYVLPEGFSGDLTIEIINAAGTVVRTIRSASAAAASGRGRGSRGSGAAAPDTAAAEQEDPEVSQPAGGRGRGGVARPLTTRPGHNRCQWDYRWDDNGPMVAPGRYTVRLTSGTVNQSKSFTVKVDPRVMRDGVTQADLVAQEQFLLEVRDAIAQANALRGRIQQAMQQKGVPSPPAPGVGESPEAVRYGDPLRGLWARVVSAGGAYPEPMLIDQLQNIQRMVGGADQKVGQEAIKRFDDLMKELKAIEAAGPR